MLINSLRVAGFRGFNEERAFDFHEKLTVISAPNSHGKTSISEALEFLLYGSTSKVDKADSKDEYKDSYRNRHFPGDQVAYIEAVMELAPDTVQVLRVEFALDGSVNKKIDGVSVDTWPFQEESIKAGRPFVLQHALKNLLLVPPVDRFKGFAELLGLNEVDSVFRALISLCTKASATVPEEAQRLIAELQRAGVQMSLNPNLKGASEQLQKGDAGVARAFAMVEARADSFLGEATEESKDRAERLEEARSTMASKIYSGSIGVDAMSSTDVARIATLRTTLASATDKSFLDDYALICIGGVEARLQKEATLLQLGSELMEEMPDACPLCLQVVSEDVRASMTSRHEKCRSGLEEEITRKQARMRVRATTGSLSGMVSTYKDAVMRPAADLITSLSPENESRVAELLGGTESESTKLVRVAAEAAQGAKIRMEDTATEITDAANACVLALEENTASLADAERLARAINAYLVSADEASKTIAGLVDTVEAPAKTFKQAVDALAGTAEIATLVELLKSRGSIGKASKVLVIIEELKELKKSVEQTLSETVEATMNAELTALVMKWYSLIKTTGDPEVHFSGFAMERTKSGDFKSGKLAVKAESYGVELASAVSSLSESKLNALGLCVSIASAIRQAGPWSFLIIDDPIQSWDDDHEIQFVQVIRSLVEEESKQLVVLTHKSEWAKSVCEDGCRSINGNRYEITGYAKAGPNVVQIDWSTFDDRIREARAIASDTTASSVRLQQAEEEVRQATCLLTARIAKDKLKRDVNTNKLNRAGTRAILIEAGVPERDTDRLTAAFAASDDSHHTPKTYRPSAEHVRQALGAIQDVVNWSKQP
jgi:hypothetical protein